MSFLDNSQRYRPETIDDAKSYNRGWDDAIEWNRDARIRTLAERDDLKDQLRSANSQIERLEQILELLCPTVQVQPSQPSQPGNNYQWRQI